MGSKDAACAGLKWAPANNNVFILKTLIQTAAFCFTTQLHASQKHKLSVWMKLSAKFPLIPVASHFCLGLVSCECTGPESTNDYLTSQTPSVKSSSTSALENLNIQFTSQLCNNSAQKQRCKEGINSRSKYHIYAFFSCHIKYNYFWCNQTHILQMDISSTKFRTSSFKHQALRAKL